MSKKISIRYVNYIGPSSGRDLSDEQSHLAPMTGRRTSVYLIILMPISIGSKSDGQKMYPLDVKNIFIRYVNYIGPLPGRYRFAERVITWLISISEQFGIFLMFFLTEN